MTIIQVCLKKFRRFVKFCLIHIPFGRKILESYGFKRCYKNYFGKVKFQGQFFQDMVAYMMLHKKKNGFFVDVGANDGFLCSNTYFFEKLGWKGICIEPQPDVFSHYLIKNRKCDCFNVALSSDSYKEIDFLKADAHALSGISDNICEEKRKRAMEYGKTEIIKVKTMTFNDIMEKYPTINHIDFLSIDVEGHELEILKVIDFKKYSFGFLTIEGSEPDKIIDYLKQNGYKKFMEAGDDIMFIPENL
jgi:FkbM family methyltransferase